jgi:hypothetical protein
LVARNDGVTPLNPFAIAEGNGRGEKREFEMVRLMRQTVSNIVMVGSYHWGKA